MADHQDGGAVLHHLFHAPVALGLEENVTHGEGLVHDQDLRLHVDGQRKGKADEHTGGIGLHGLVHEIPDVREVQDVLHFCVHLLPGEAHHGPVHVDVLYTGVVGIEARAQLQQGGDVSVHLHRSGGGAQDAGDDLQDRGLSGAVGPDDAHGLALFHVEGKLVQGEEVLVIRLVRETHGFLQPVDGPVVELVNFCDLLHGDRETFVHPSISFTVRLRNAAGASGRSSDRRSEAAVSPSSSRR